MQRVIGIGGIFIKSSDPQRLRDWYQKHLGVDVQPWGGAVFDPAAAAKAGLSASTHWSVFEQSNDYFDPSKAPFMVNYVVADLDAVIEALKSEGCDVADKREDSEYGRFGWVMDPDGNRVELWQPPAADAE